ncbi:MAG: hypothetical protein ABIR70_05800 [Bryobacteraceae bacterium]
MTNTKDHSHLADKIVEQLNAQVVSASDAMVDALHLPVAKSKAVTSMLDASTVRIVLTVDVDYEGWIIGAAEVE